MGRLTGGLFFMFKLRLWMSLISIVLVLLAIVLGILKMDADIRAKTKQAIVDQEGYAQNIDQFVQDEIANCASVRAEKKAAPLGYNLCKCMIDKRMAYSPLPADQGFDAHLRTGPVTDASFLTIPPEILLDLYMSGALADKITELGLDNPEKFEPKAAQNLELYMMRASTKDCLERKRLSNWTTYFKQKPRYDALTTAIQNINAVTAKRDEMIQDGRIAG